MTLKKIHPDIWRKLADEKAAELDAMYRVREQMIVEQYNNNWSKARIARHWSITLERVRQILIAAGAVK